MTELEFEEEYAKEKKIAFSDGIVWTAQTVAMYWIDFQESLETFCLVQQEIESRPMPTWFNDVWDNL